MGVNDPFLNWLFGNGGYVSYDSEPVPSNKEQKKSLVIYVGCLIYNWQGFCNLQL